MCRILSKVGDPSDNLVNLTTILGTNDIFNIQIYVHLRYLQFLLSRWIGISSFTSTLLQNGKHIALTTCIRVHTDFRSHEELFYIYKGLSFVSVSFNKRMGLSSTPLFPFSIALYEFAAKWPNTKMDFHDSTQYCHMVQQGFRTNWIFFVRKLLHGKIIIPIYDHRTFQ